jgi:hypothetical protein
MVRKAMRMSLAATVASAAAGSGLAACANGDRVPSRSPYQTFAAAGIRFTYPALWNAYQFSWASSFSNSLAYVSNVPLHRPCVGRPLGPDCQGPIAELPENSALLVWTANGFPTWSFDKAHGKLLHVNGRRARLRWLTPQPAWCPRNSDTMLDVIIERHETPDNWYELRACMSGPQLGQVRRQVMAILRSFRAAG